MTSREIFKKARLQDMCFENHPIKDLDLEGKILYLKGLALIMYFDDEIHEKEKEFLIILIRSAGLQDDQYGELEKFAKEPDERTIHDIVHSLVGKDLRFNFFLDSINMSNQDGQNHEVERECLHDLATWLKLTPDEIIDLHSLYHMIVAKDITGLWLIFQKPKAFKITWFEYLLKYYFIDFQSVVDNCETNDEWLRIKDTVTGEWRYLNLVEGTTAPEIIDGCWLISSRNPNLVTDVHTGRMWLEQDIFWNPVEKKNFKTAALAS